MIPRLQEFANANSERLGYGNKETVGIFASNLDDVFRLLFVMEIPEVEVTREQMHLITAFMVSNVSGADYKGELTQTETWKVLREGKVDKYLGVKLKLI